jgi:molybdopterin synthase catalytic subunit
VISITGVHRVGLLKIGEIAVWIGVASAHRGPGFDACRYVIDELKARVPIWKKEHYQEGPSEWINCATRTEPVDPPKPALT